MKSEATKRSKKENFLRIAEIYTCIKNEALDQLKRDRLKNNEFVVEVREIEWRRGETAKSAQTFARESVQSTTCRYPHPNQYGTVYANSQQPPCQFNAISDKKLPFTFFFFFSRPLFIFPFSFLIVIRLGFLC